tara:strand:- start:314 stop:733 length:420 start_codon:yes stop_codon:yes gene_type:complete
LTDWIRLQIPSGNPDELGPLQLAWLGDAVWEMHQRIRFCKKPGRAKELHQAVVSEVKACAQVEALNTLEPLLNEVEKNYIRRGRNSSGRGSRKLDPATYAMATGFETMVGWLFLKNPERLADLFDYLQESHLDIELLKK